MAKVFNQDPTPETVRKLLSGCWTDTKNLIEVRKVQGVEGHAKVFQQINEQWKAFCRRCPTVNDKAYMLMIAQAVPKRIFPGE